MTTAASGGALTTRSLLRNGQPVPLRAKVFDTFRRWKCGKFHGQGIDRGKMPVTGVSAQRSPEGYTELATSYRGRVWLVLKCGDLS
jgi:hypothetical protein